MKLTITIDIEEEDHAALVKRAGSKHAGELTARSIAERAVRRYAASLLGRDAAVVEQTRIAREIEDAKADV